MAEVQVEMADINAVLNSNPTFAQAVQVAAMNRRIDELEAEKAAVPVCDCQQNDSSEDEQE